MFPYEMDNIIWNKKYESIFFKGYMYMPSALFVYLKIRTPGKITKVTFSMLGVNSAPHHAGIGRVKKPEKKCQKCSSKLVPKKA